MRAGTASLALLEAVAVAVHLEDKVAIVFKVKDVERAKHLANPMT